MEKESLREVQALLTFSPDTPGQSLCEVVLSVGEGVSEAV